MEKATLNRPNKPLLMGFVNNNYKIDPFTSNRCGLLFAVIVLTMLLCLTMNVVHATPPVDHCPEEPNPQVQRTERLNQVINDYNVDGSQFNDTRVKSYRQKGNRQIFKFEDGSKLVVNTKKNKVKIVNKTRNIPNKTNNSAKPNNIKIPKTKTKAVLKFDESGLIGYKIGNKKTKLNKPIPKNGFIKKIESKVDGTLKKIKITHTPKQTKVVSVFKIKPKHEAKPVTVQKPNNEPHIEHEKPEHNSQIDNIPHEIVTNEPIIETDSLVHDEKNIVEDKISNKIDEPAKKSEVLKAPAEQVANTEQKVPELLDTSDQTSTSSQQQPVEKVLPPVLTVKVVPNPINAPAKLASAEKPVSGDSQFNTPTNTQVVSITQPIIGEPETEIVSLNLGEPNNPFDQAPPQQQGEFPQPLFNARIADTTEEISETETSGSQSMPVNKIAYVDVNAYSKKNTNMFGTIGTGIGMKLGQCEEMDGCAPSLDETSLEEIEQKLHAELEQLAQLEVKKSSSHIKRKKQALLFKVNALKQHKEQLNLFKSQELENQVAMDKLSKPDVIPESEFPLRQSDNSSTNESIAIDMSQFDTSIFEDYQQEIADDI